MLPLKKTVCRLFSVILLLAALHGVAVAALPELSGWENGELRKTTLDTVSGNKGLWEERGYRAPNGERYHVVWIEGAGEKGWQPPSENHDGSGDLLESGATYKNIELLGNRAIFEDQLLFGKSLTLKITNKGTLTIETPNASEPDLLDTVRQIASFLIP